MLNTYQEISIFYFEKIFYSYTPPEIGVFEAACMFTRFSSYTNASKYYLWMKNKQILTSSISKKIKCRFLRCDGNVEQFISE